MATLKSTSKRLRVTGGIVGIAALAVSGGAATGAFAGSSPSATSGTVPVSQWRTADAYTQLRSGSAATATAAVKNPELVKVLAKSKALPAVDGVPVQLASYVGTDGPCIVEVDPDGGAGIACSTAKSTSPPTVSGTTADGRSFVVGLAPDNVNYVTAQFADGSKKELSVNGNAYGAITSQPLSDGDAVAVPGFDGTAVK